MRAAKITPFANRVRRRMAELGISEGEAARRIGVSGRRLNHYIQPRPKTGRPSDPKLHVLARICGVLGVSADYLIGLRDEPAVPVDGSDVEARLRRVEQLLGL